MGSGLRRALRIGLGLVSLVLLFIFSAEFFLEKRLQNVLNANPQRKYDISFQELEIHSFFKGVDLEEVSITPVQPDSVPIAVYGTLDHARITGLVWMKLFFQGSLSLDEIRFIEPEFNIYRKTKRDTSHHEAPHEKGVQLFFEDLLSRGSLSSFSIKNGNASYYLLEKDSIEFARFHNFGMEANEIQTDKVRLKYPVPFEMSDFRFSLDSLYFRPNADMKIRTGFLEYSSAKNSFSLHDASVKYTRPWQEISREIGEQKDLVEVELEQLDIIGIKPLSQLFGNLDMRANKIQLTGLSFYDFKNLNLPLLKKDYKPMFLGMINRIPFKLQLDTLQIRDSHIEYFEISPQRAKPGVIVFDSFSADIFHISNQEEYRDLHHKVTAEFQTQFNGAGQINAQLEVPYEKEFFHLHAEMGRMPLSALNKTLGPLAGIRITEGDIHRLMLDMKADSLSSENKLELDYENIGFMVLDRGNEWKPKDRTLLSALAKMAVHKTNLPNEKGYRSAHYTANRIAHKSPFNFMWVSLKEGCVYIIPGKLARTFIHHDGQKLD